MDSHIVRGIALLILIPMITLNVPAAAAEYSIRLGEDSIGVSISADFAQGVPNPYANTTRIFKEIPVFTISLEGDNSSLIAMPLNEAIKAKSPSATVTQVRFAASSNGTWMHYDFSFNVQGVSSSSQGVLTSELGWRSFSIPTEVTVASYSINNLLPAYLGDEVIGLTQEFGGVPIQQQRNWYFNGRFRSGTQIVALVPKMLLFNFTSLVRPLESWTETRDIDKPSTTWRASTGFNLTFIGILQDPEALLVFGRNAIYNVETVVEAPGLGQAQGDIILFEGQSTPGAVLMAATIIASLSLFIVTMMLERRCQRPSKSFRKGKR